MHDLQLGVFGGGVPDLQQRCRELPVLGQLRGTCMRQWLVTARQNPEEALLVVRLVPKVSRQFASVLLLFLFGMFLY